MVADDLLPTDIPKERLLRNEVKQHLLNLGFSENCDAYVIDEELTKQKIRNLHALQRQEILARNKPFIETFGSTLTSEFASGKDIDPSAIEPELVEIKPGSRESRLFRFACLLWSIPVSLGFGRRLRFLVRDRQNGCLIGIFALGDPVFNLSARDNWIGWSHELRKAQLVHVMDAYVVGAVPPYSKLIGGKLVAALIASSEVMQAYQTKYIGRTSVITKRENNAHLVLLTTTSALGRSSIYNRLSVLECPQFIRIGTTRGFGHFHLSGPVFESLRTHLQSIGHPYASGYRFGMGSNWKIRVIRAALTDIGIDADAILKHGIEREVYAIPLAKNWKTVLLGLEKSVRSCVTSTEEISDFCLNRWIVPRAVRDDSFKKFQRHTIMECLLNGDLKIS